MEIYFIYKREFDQSPTMRRNDIRHDGELWNFAIQ